MSEPSIWSERRDASALVRAEPFLVRAADRLYAECERAIREGRIDARSAIGDATLEYREIRDAAEAADEHPPVWGPPEEHR